MTLTQDALERCQVVLHYQFKNPDLLRQALVHASVADSRLASNERLEFLGDAVLGMIIAHELYQRFPDYLEGELTKIKSMLVSRRTCAKLTNQLGLTDFLHLGKGILAQNKIPTSCSAAVLESVIGAIYLDGGERAARRFIIRITKPLLDEADAKKHQGNYKSMLQQHAQHIMDSTPIYEVLDEKGPDHSKCFEVSVVIANRRFSSAWGPSKKEAEQNAAYCALQELNLLDAERSLASSAGMS